MNNYQDDWVWIEDSSVWDTLMEELDLAFVSSPAPTATGVVWGGSATYYGGNVVHPSGGATWGGLASTRTTYNWTMSGAYVYGGAATVTYKSPRFYPSGGAVWNGVATVIYHSTTATSSPENPNLDSFTAWAVNYQTGAVSRYDAMPATSCCFFNGVLYVTNAAGVYAVDNTSDQGVNINSSVDFGLTDFGKPEDKRVPALYLGASSSGSLAVNARTNIGELGYYGMDLSPAGWHGSRATLGRGVQARYWQFRVVSINGSTMEIDAISLDPLILKRRGV